MDEDIKMLANNTVDKIYRKIKRVYSSDFHRLGSNVGIGADGTTTKYIDKVAEDVALKYLKKSSTKVNILSEEAGFVDQGGKYTFVLDPVDGTRNAYRGIPFFSVSLGVGNKTMSDVEYGIVKNVASGDVFVAEKDHGSFLNNTPIMVPDMPGREMLSSLSLGKNINKKTMCLAKKGVVRSLGSASLEMCMVALGGLDYYVVGQEFLRVTDIAASTLILREAKGFVTNIAGVDLEMPLNLDERTSVVAACNQDLIDEIVSC